MNNANSLSLQEKVSEACVIRKRSTIAEVIYKSQWVVRSSQKGKTKMNMGSQLKNLEGRNIDAKAIGIRKMSDEEYGRQLVEIKAQLNVLTKLIQHNEESQRYGCNLRKRVKCPIKIL